ncbi:MAG TPA: hypothetical protein VIJ82_11275 [Streptosporangiaceae bacterium]|jgi:hypothetical protein
MTGLAQTVAAASAVVDGVDLDAVAAAVRGCGGVDDLVSGAWGGVVSYLPGRQVPGVRVTGDQIVVSVRGRWGVPAAELARQIRLALTALVGSRRIDVIVADVTDDPALADEVTSWTTSSVAPGAPTSGPGIPTGAATHRPSSPG